MINHKVKCANFEIANNKSFTLIAGPCQLESEQHALDISRELKKNNLRFKNKFNLQNFF
jgi:2-dehydro-3-deoxyphosphooctonate aldolase (KDO 8-P synthase)